MPFSTIKVDSKHFTKLTVVTKRGKTLAILTIIFFLRILRFFYHSLCLSWAGIAIH